MAAGGFHTCAVLTEGRVRCWGANWDGELGTGQPVDGDETYTPLAVEGF